MKLIYTLLIGVTTLTVFAQSKSPVLEYSRSSYVLDAEKFHAEYNLNTRGLDLGSNEMMLITPRLEAVDGSDSYDFSPILISGSKRNNVLKRSESLSGNMIDIPIYVHNKNSAAVVPLSLSAPAQPWMRAAKLVFKEEITGCAECGLFTNVREFVLPVQAPYMPDYTLSYVRPAAEEVKERSKGYAAKFSYQVGKYDILPDFANNAQVVRELTQLIEEVKSDKNLTITGAVITGYASPDGSYTSNLRLSENRAKAFADFLTRRYGIAEDQLTVEWKGEDWTGFAAQIEASSLTNKDELLRIIKSGKAPDAQEQDLKRLDSGRVFRILLQDYFPQLRRNELNLNFVVKAFDVEEAKAIIRTNPQYLSLNEMYLVANSYPKESAEFKEVFDIASRMYPQDAVAQLNAATADIEAGSLERAIVLLEKQHTADAWNNLGVAYAKKGDLDKATELFKKAIKSGHDIAKKNLVELEKAKDKF